MKKTVNVIIGVILWIWQFPQNSLGWLLWQFFFHGHATFTHKRARIMFTYQIKGGVTLGKWVFIDARYYGRSYGAETMKHEYGHVIQSLLLGWLYLPYIGIQSLIHAIFCRNSDYYHFWTEKWANKLADKYYD